MREKALLNWQKAIREYLKRENLSHAEFSQKLGIPETRVNAWLRNAPHTTAPTWETVVQVFNTVDINPFLALYGIKESKEISDMKAQLASLQDENTRLKITVQTLRQMDDETG